MPITAVKSVLSSPIAAASLTQSRAARVSPRWSLHATNALSGSRFETLTETVRGAGGFGSTGVHATK